jgi:hypothetical protein
LVIVNLNVGFIINNMSTKSKSNIFGRLLNGISRALIVVVFISLLLANGLIHQSTSPVNMPAMASPGQRAPQSVSDQLHDELSQTSKKPTGTYDSMTAAYYNWSGYAVNAPQPFLEVTSTYTQPAVTCPVAGAWTLFWVGFDGFTNDTVEQSGTAALCQNTSKPTYYAWWEMYPTNTIQLMPITIKVGNKVQDTVTYNPAASSYSLAVNDLSNKQQYTETTQCATNLNCARQSAEWIVERPTVNGTYAPLADWKKMSLGSDLAGNTAISDSNPATLMLPVNDYENTNISMIDDPYTGEYLATDSNLNAAGKSFTDTWLNTQ